MTIRRSATWVYTLVSLFVIPFAAFSQIHSDYDCPPDDVVYVDSECGAILANYTSGITRVALASPSDFSSTQGDVWHYGSYAFGDYLNFIPLAWDGNIWKTPGATYDLPSVDAYGGHPGIDLPGLTSVRRWISTVSDNVVFEGLFYDRNTDCGDGVNVRIYINGSQVYEYLNVPDFSVWYSQTEYVQLGDTIDFVIDRKFDGGCDDTQFENNIYLEVQESQTPLPGTAISGTTQVAVNLVSALGTTISCPFEVFAAPIDGPSTCNGCPADPTYDATLSSPIMIGAGISNEHMAIGEYCDIELGLKALKRHRGDILPNGSNYKVGTGWSPVSAANLVADTGTARWNYVLSVNLGTFTFDDIDVTLAIDFDPDDGPGQTGPFLVDISQAAIDSGMVGLIFIQDSQNLGFYFW